MVENVSEYCGRKGRIARANLRGGVPSADDLTHIRGCQTCRMRIIDSIRNNLRTTYKGSSFDEAITQYRAMQRRRDVRSWLD